MAEDMAGAEASTVDNPFKRLPVEVVKKILGLDEQYGDIYMNQIMQRDDDRRRMRSTCRLFSSLITDEGRFEWRFTEAKDTTDFVNFMCSKLDTKWKKLKLHFDASELCLVDIRAVLPTAILPFSKTLEYFGLNFWHENQAEKDMIGWDTLFVMLQTCKNLRHIFIRRGEGVPLGASNARVTVPTQPLPSLLRLSLLGLCIPAVTLERMLLALPKLEHLYIKLDGGMDNTYLVKSDTLRTMKWLEGIEMGARIRITIDCNSLEELILETEARFHLICPSLSKLVLNRLVNISLSSTWALKEVVFDQETAWVSVRTVLRASPGVETIGIKHIEGLPSFQRLGRLCKSVRTLRLLHQAWTDICAVVRAPSPEQGSPAKKKPCFPQLQRIKIGADFETDRSGKVRTGEALSTLRVLLASCSSLQQMDIEVWLAREQPEDIVSVVNDLAQEYPTCWFTVEDGKCQKRILEVKGNRRTNFHPCECTYDSDAYSGLLSD